MDGLNMKPAFPDGSPLGNLLNQVYAVHNQEITELKNQIEKLKEELRSLKELKSSSPGDNDRKPRKEANGKAPVVHNQNSASGASSRSDLKTSEEIPGTSQKEISIRRKISPRSLRIRPVANKRSRFSEEAPTRKKPKLAPHNTDENQLGPNHRLRIPRTVALFTDSETQPVKECTRPVLAPETCDLTMDSQDHPVRAALEAAKKTHTTSSSDEVVDLTLPVNDKESDDDDIVEMNDHSNEMNDKESEDEEIMEINDHLKEVVPVNDKENEQENNREGNDEQDEWKSDEESQSQIFTEPMTVRDMILSPPANASTPLCLNRDQKNNLPKALVGNSLLETESDDSNDSIQLSLKFPARNQNKDKIDISNSSPDCDHPASPIFKKTTGFRRIIPDEGTRSPSLFDDPESPVFNNPPPTANGSKATDRKVPTTNENDNNDTSNCSMSPSVLDGNSSKKPPSQSLENEGFLSSRVGPKSDDKSLKRSKGEQGGSERLKCNYFDLEGEDDSLRSTGGARSQKRKVTQSRNSPLVLEKNLKGNKSLKQITLSQVFVPKTTHLPGRESFNGGRLGGKSSKSQAQNEDEDIEEAIQRSLKDIGGPPNQDLFALDGDGDITECGETHTKDSSKYSVFKIPKAPGAVHTPGTSHKVKNPENHSHETSRHSKNDKGKKDKTMDGELNFSEGRRKLSEKQRVDLSSSTLVPWSESLHLDTEMGPGGNGSLGPGVILSELEGDVSGPSDGRAEEEEMVEGKEEEEEEEAISMVSEDGPSHLDNKSNVDLCDDSSFDRLPQKERPKYAHVEVVRKKAERAQLKAYVCAACEEYYAGENLTDKEREEKMKSCRHKARYAPPSTPEHFWSIGIPDTPECEERGYFQKTQHKPSKFRRRRRYNQLFKSANDKSEATQGGENEEHPEDEDEEEENEADF